MHATEPFFTFCARDKGTMTSSTTTYTVLSGDIQDGVRHFMEEPPYLERNTFRGKR